MSQHQLIPHTLFSQLDIDLFNSGNHCQLYNKFGSHPKTVNKVAGTYFAVYAPSAFKVEVIGDFNGWNGSQHALNVRWDHSGIWEGFISGIGHGSLYKYRIYSNHDTKIREKADPFARCYEMPPKSASVVWHDDYQWQDSKWLQNRPTHNSLSSPISIYELHLGSWQKQLNQTYSLSYRQLADKLVRYLKDMNYTHVEFLPVMEHPYYPSWGYLCTGYFAPTRRYGDPDEFKYLVDALHRANIGVYLDWVPAHFPNDEQALIDFDGSCVYEHPDKQKGYHPDWNSAIFNFERPQVVSFLLSSAHFWCQQFHADGLRVDAVASMIYLDYSRKDGEWSPNIYGGNEYLAAIDFLKKLNTNLYRDFPDIQMIAEESTAFPKVTVPTTNGGLGFGMKWMMGWMNDSLDYFKRDSIYRKYHHNEISHSFNYVFSENFLLPLSHDEVVHGKGSILSRMPGDSWQQFANLRLLYTYMYCHPGQKLLFMGSEIGQRSEWSVNHSVDWQCLTDSHHQGIQHLVKRLNQLYRQQKALHFDNFNHQTLQYVETTDHTNSILCYTRATNNERVIVLLNFTPTAHQFYRVGIKANGRYQIIFNSDDHQFGGSNYNSQKVVQSEAIAWHNQDYSLVIKVPPLAGIVIKKVD